MNWKDISGMVGKAAPLLGTALGGPAGGAIGGMIANVLGVENKPDEVAKAIAADPEAAIKLKKFEFDNQADIRNHAFQTLDVELKDKQDARKNHHDSKMPAIICGLLTFLVGAGAYMLFTVDIPDGNREIAYLLFGSLLTKWGDSIAYWVGTSRSSALKNNWAKVGT